MLKRLGNIKYSILVQQLISMALFIPILSLGRLIFSGFENKKFLYLFEQIDRFMKEPSKNVS
jgi:O-antigen/teichoic acid export membrane protein